jgi:hypothetical protein
MPQIFYQTIRARVRNPFLPVDISTRLPLHLTRITGIQCRYSSGIERIVPRIAADMLPRIGWFTLDVNNRKRPLGVFEVRYERPSVDANDDYQDIDVPIQGGSMITGTYNNELQYPYGVTPATPADTPEERTVATSSTVIEYNGGGLEGTGQVVAYDGFFFDTPKIRPVDIRIVNPADTSNYDGYIVAIYLKCIGETTLK